MDKRDERDRPVKAEEIEVTPEMADVGAAVIAGSYDDAVDDLTRQVAREVFTEMLRTLRCGG